MLLKGVNKRVIVIKNPESEIFEEAYFIIRSNNIKGVFKQSKENEMVIEANRIISDYHSQQKKIIEKNGISSSIGGDMTELDNFLNKKNDTATKINDMSSSVKPGINNTTAHLSDEEIFEDEKFFENMQDNTGKYNKYDKYDKEETPFKSAFNFISSKKIRGGLFGNIPFPPKSFFVGVGFMSAVIILIRLIELIVLS